MRKMWVWLRAMTDKPKLIHPDRSLSFSQRYGYRPLPNAMDYTLCKEFRDGLGALMERSFDGYPGDWLAVWHATEQHVLEVEYRNLYKVPTSYNYMGTTTHWEKLHTKLQGFVAAGEFHTILSFIQFALRRGGMSDAWIGIRELFTAGLAPYAIDNSAQPVCVIPVDTPENADNTVAAIETLHDHGATNAHQCLRNAGRHINAGHYEEAVTESIRAVESVARGVGDGKTLDDAVKQLHNSGIIPHPALAQAISKFYGFAGDTSRHGQPNDKPATIAREEALLAFSFCASLSAYLLQKAPESTRSKNSQTTQATSPSSGNF